MKQANPSGPKNGRPLARKIARISAYALLAGTAVLILSGWGISQTGIIYRISFGLIDRRAANAIHRAANAPVAFFFLLHVLINLRYALKRKIHIPAWIIDGLLILLGLCLMGIVIYMEYFRLGG